MDAETAGKLLSCSEEEEEFHERFQILMRMHTDEKYTEEVVSYFKPQYTLWILEISWYKIN